MGRYGQSTQGYIGGSLFVLVFLRYFGPVYHSFDPFVNLTSAISHV